MRGPSTPMRGALLGLLLEQPGHGGDLANRLAARLSNTWRVDTNDVYRLLDQLQKMGLAITHNEPKRNNRRRMHLVYHPTEKTPEALTLWMETLLPREPVRLTLQAKLSVARQQDAPHLLVALQAYEHECQALAQLVSPSHGTGQTWLALCIDCTHDAAYAQLQTEVNWATRTIQRINEFLEHTA